MTGFINVPDFSIMNKLIQTIDFSTTPWKTASASQKKLFTVSGSVMIYLFPGCTASITGTSAVMSLGSAGTIGYYIGDTTATNIAGNEIWESSTKNTYIARIYTPTAGGAAVANFPIYACTSEHIGLIVKTADTTGGTIQFVCFWQPLTPGATVTAGDGSTL